MCRTQNIPSSVTAQAPVLQTSYSASFLGGEHLQALRQVAGSLQDSGNPDSAPRDAGRSKASSEAASKAPRRRSRNGGKDAGSNTGSRQSTWSDRHPKADGSARNTSSPIAVQEDSWAETDNGMASGAATMGKQLGAGLRAVLAEQVRTVYLLGHV